jgi:hypothetical protein
MRGMRIAVMLVAAAVAVVGLAQLLGPAIAAKVVRGKVARYGTVRSVTVKAWPAVKLLWREADEVRVTAGALRLSPPQTVAMLREAKGTDRVSARAESVEEGSLQVTDGRLRKAGRRLWAQGVVSEADVKRALPAGVSARLLRSEGGTAEVQVSGSLFGVAASVDAIAEAKDGKLVVHPTGLWSALTVTVFADPSIYVEGVHVSALPSEAGSERSYELTMWASLR